MSVYGVPHPPKQGCAEEQGGTCSVAAIAEQWCCIKHRNAAGLKSPSFAIDLLPSRPPSCACPPSCSLSFHTHSASAQVSRPCVDFFCPNLRFTSVSWGGHLQFPGWSHFTHPGLGCLWILCNVVITRGALSFCLFSRCSVLIPRDGNHFARAQC